MTQPFSQDTLPFFKFRNVVSRLALKMRTVIESSGNLCRRLAVLFFALLIALPGIPSDGVSDVYRRALHAKQRGELGEAVSLLQETLRMEPGLTQARFELGLAYLDLERWNEAEAEFKAFLEVRPASYEAHNNLAAIYARLGDSTQLHRELSEVVRLRPDFIPGHINLSDYHIMLALRSLWTGYKMAKPEERGAFKQRILRILDADPDMSEEYFVEGRIARIRVEPVYSRASEVSAVEGQAARKTFEIQVFSTQSEPESQRMARRISRAGYRPEIRQAALGGANWYRIRIGGFVSADKAIQAATKLISAGVIREYWVVP